MKYIKLSVMILCGLILGIINFYLGIRYEEWRLQKDEQYITQNIIAVVNIDEGIIVDGNRVNYAAELMSFPDVNFISTSLADARDGVAGGRYGAYIIIPNNFSQAVASINGEPEKANITYEIGNNLRADIKEEVTQDIQDFTANLSTNISYVYVDSIMGEFHSAQNGAKRVLDNDVSELEQVNAIEYEALIEAFVFPEVQRKEWELEDIDLSEHYNVLDENVLQINSSYEEYLAEGRLALMELDQRREEVSISVLNLTDALESIDVEYKYIEPIHGEEGSPAESVSQNTVYANGIMHLRNFEEDRTAQLEANKTELQGIIIGDGAGHLDETEKTMDEKTGLSNVSESLQTNQTAIEERLQEVQESEISVRWNSAGDSVSINSTDQEHNTDADYADRYMVIERQTFEKLMKEVESLNETGQQLQDARINLLAVVNEIDADSGQKAQAIITDEIVSPLEENINSESARIRSVERDVSRQINSFIDELDTYDPLEYVKEDEIDERLLLIRENIGKMETTIEESNLEYFEFVSDVYDISDENYEKLLEEVELTNEQTASNISTTIESAKASRQEKNEINSLLLDDFTQKLSYTRIGNLENEMVNEFIVSPIEISDVNTIHTSAGDKGVNSQWIFIVIAVIFLVFVLLLISRIIYLYTTKEGRRGTYETGL